MYIYIYIYIHPRFAEDGGAAKRGGATLSHYSLSLSRSLGGSLGLSLSLSRSLHTFRPLSPSLRPAAPCSEGVLGPRASTGRRCPASPERPPRAARPHRGPDPLSTLEGRRGTRASPGCRVAGLPGCRVAGLPGCRVAGLAAWLPGCLVAWSPRCFPGSSDSACRKARSTRYLAHVCHVPAAHSTSRHTMTKTRRTTRIRMLRHNPQPYGCSSAGSE